MSSQDNRAKYVQNGVMEVFDPNFKYLYLVPAHFVLHVPPARLNISRLVICRNYRSGVPNSCAKEESCRFVHADVDYSTLEAHPIHVNYIWRHEDHCTYERLPAGDVLEVCSQENPQEHELISSELVLVTRGSVAHHNALPHSLMRCPLYTTNRMCSRGERCSFIHTLCVDPTVVGDFKRAPARTAAVTPTPRSPAVASATDSQKMPRTFASGTPMLSDFCISSPEREAPALSMGAGGYTALSFRVDAAGEPLPATCSVIPRCRVTARVRTSTVVKSRPTLVAAFSDASVSRRSAMATNSRPASYCHNPYYPVLCRS
ncbi:zinc finger protein family member, putative [Trypanosoma equiperdum]|uniref:C3H1-type domain-containing protein n=2 Tax=Trypanozoon TaxID=39700 RepID=Q388W9_TRYB2|nr:hypothetical protein, conserved [Trypanosoma brucei brucei TREU927]EAN78651.1 hypothetical protein, conserved [Trypanosoma brucei brucei TREU927]SCU64224.1 zinc finger protein family member, putative [Trypanosoma equiperdum]